GIFHFLFKGLYHLLKVIFSDEFCFFCVDVGRKKEIQTVRKQGLSDIWREKKDVLSISCSAHTDFNCQTLRVQPILIRRTEDSGTESNVDCGGPAPEVLEGKNDSIRELRFGP
ncbi:hypothetical protein STEG23_019544, partial [Scotinomys teguina]